jgi:hypothetical protein
LFGLVDWRWDLADDFVWSSGVEIASDYGGVNFFAVGVDGVFADSGWFNLDVVSEVVIIEGGLFDESVVR